MRYCLDTNVVIDILRGDSQLKSRVENAVKQGITFCTTSIVLCELFKGAFLAQKHNEALKLVEDFAESTELLAFDELACRIFGQKYAELQKKGKKTQELDLMIASIAISHDLPLITRNPDDFTNIEGLKYFSW